MTLSVPMLAEGDVVTTVSGRQTSPFPRIDSTSERRMANTLSRVTKWLWANAKTEISVQGLIDTLPQDPRQMTQADRDIASLVLFGTT